ncbi:MAG: Gldg family protein, partial [Alphaproteobacteria bacterium]
MNLDFHKLLANRRTLGGLSVALVLVLFVAVNVLSQRALVGARLDLTQDRLFTLTQGTRTILNSMDEPITLRFYFSAQLGKELPGLAKYAARVRGLLEEFAAISGEGIRLEVIDPIPFSDAEDQAVSFALQGIPLDRTGEMVYFGLAGTNSTDDEETILFFSPDREQFLEYDLAKLIFNLINPKRKTVGLMTTLPLKGYPGSIMARISSLGKPWRIIKHLEQSFALTTVKTDAEEIPADVDVLLVVHPAKLPAKTLYAIDQFILGGGRAVIMVDPLAEVAERIPGFTGKKVPISSDLKPLFDAWGIELAPGKAVGDRLAARRVNAGTRQKVQPVDYPPWLALQKANFAADDLTTSELDAMNMAAAGALKLKPGAKVKFTPLIRSSDKSMLMDVEKLKGKPDFFALLRDFKPANIPFAIAARISGPVKSAYPDGPPKPEEKKDAKDDKDKKDEKDEKTTEKTESEKAETAKEKAEAESRAAAKRAKQMKSHLKASKDDINVIVITDVDMLQDRFWVQLQNLFGEIIPIPISNNVDFVVNALDNLSGSNALIGLRARGVSSRPFTVVEDLTRAAELRLRAKERELQTRRQDTEKKLEQLQRPGQAQGTTAVLTQAQVTEINKFKGELLRIRKQLRQVQLELRRDIETLQGQLWFINIALIPMLVAVIAIVLSLLR